jgi:hypothetical protein
MEKLWSREIRPFPKKALQVGLVTLSGGCGLTRRSESGTAKGKLRWETNYKDSKLNLRLLRRRENAVQRTPPRA